MSIFGFIYRVTGNFGVGITTKLRVHGFIYGGSGSAGMGVGHSWGFLLICSPCILEISSIFGYSGGLNKNCSPCPIHVWVQMTLFEEMFSFLIEIHGEQSGANGHLYPNSRRYSLDHGEQILLICFLCPNTSMPALPAPPYLKPCTRSEGRFHSKRQDIKIRRTPAGMRRIGILYSISMLPAARA